MGILSVTGLTTCCQMMHQIDIFEITLRNLFHENFEHAINFISSEGMSEESR